MAKYQTIKKFAESTGYTESAIRTKIAKGIWPLGEVYIKAPDNHVLISVEGYEQWVESGMESGARRRPALKSVSCMKGRSAVNVSHLSPPPLT
jgi:hypothetical protein